MTAPRHAAVRAEQSWPGRVASRLVVSGAPVYVGFGLAGFVLFWRQILRTGLNLIPGSGDARLAHTILEHWRNTFSGQASWLSPPSFFPIKGTLGYTDTYFFYALLYMPLRHALDAFDSFQFLVFSLVLLSYVGMCALLRVMFRLRPSVSAFGGVLFAYSSLNASRLGHVQLLISSVFPVLLGCAWFWIRSFRDRFSRGLVAGSVGAILLAGALFTSYNASWLLCLYGVIWIAVFAAFWFASSRMREAFPRPRESSDAGISKGVLYLGVPFAIFVVSLTPFLLTYAPMVAAGYGSSYEEMRKNLPRLLDLINAGAWNHTWGWLLPRLLPSISSRNDPLFYEHGLGFPLVFLGVFLVSIGSSWRRWRSRDPSNPGDPDARDVFVLIAGIAIVVAWLLMIRHGHFSAWRAVMSIVPGARGVRAAFRFQVVLYFFACIVVAILLDRIFTAPSRTTWRRWALATLPLVMLIEQSSDLYADIDKAQQRAMFARVGMPPVPCKVFYVAQGNPPSAQVPIDAMYVSVLRGLPTINGYNGQGPVNYSVSDPRWENYNILVAEWLVRHRLLDGVCALDFAAGTWTEIHPSGDVPRGVNLMAPDPRGEVADRMWSGLQGFAGYGLTRGQWTTGNSTVALVSPQVVNELEFSFVMSRQGGGRLRVFVDDWPVLTESFAQGGHAVKLPLHRPIQSIRFESTPSRLPPGDSFHVFRALGIHLTTMTLR